MSSTAENNLIQPGALENLDELTTSTQDALGLPYGSKNAQEMPFAQSAIEGTQPIGGRTIGDFETQTNIVVEAWQQGEASLPLFNSRGEQIDSLLGLPNSEMDLDYSLSGFSAEADVLTNSTSAASSPKQIVFVDGSVSDSDQLISDLGFPADIIYIDSTRDGVTQISEALSAHEDVAAVHILTHGGAGSLQLGATTLDSATLASYQSQLQSWADSLTENADILIYGCDVASTIGGQAFVDRIGQWTRADVAASDDLTGSVALGGDWDLEYRSGQVEIGAIASGQYQGTLDLISLNNGLLDYTKVSLAFESGEDLTLSTANGYLYLSENDAFSNASDVPSDSGVERVDDSTVRILLSNITSGIKITGMFGDDKITVSNDLAFGGLIKIDGGEGEDTIKIQGDLYTQGRDIDLSAEKITIGAGIVLSTRNTDGGNSITAVSTGESGDISLLGEQITIGEAASGSRQTQLLADIEGNGDFSAGDITIETHETEISTSLYTVGEKSEAIITLKDTIVKGGDIDISSYADYADSSGDDSVGEWVVDFLDNLAINAGIAIADATAKVTIDSNTNIVSETFKATATSMTDASTAPLISYVAGVAYARVDSTAKVSIAGSIETIGDLTVKTETDNTVNIKSDTTKWDTSNALLNSAASAAISELYTESTAEIADGATLISGGNVTIQAETIDRNKTIAKSAASADGTVALAAAISLEEGTTQALVDGNVTATGDITINASQENASVDAFFPWDRGNSVAASAGLSNANGDVIDGAKKAAASAIWDKLKSLVSSDKITEKTKGKGQTFQLGAGFAYKQDENTVIARIGGTEEDNNASDTTAAVVKSTGGAIDIDASVEYRPGVTASSTLKSKTPNTADSTANDAANSAATPTENSKFAGSAGVAIGDYINTAKAYIGKAATVDAEEDLSIESKTSNDYTLQWGVNLVEPFLAVEDGTLSDVGNAALTFSENLTGYLNGNLGLDKFAVDSWSQAIAAADTELAVAGAVTILDLTQTSKAFISESAKINQDASLRSDANLQTVSVEAKNINEAVHFAGTIDLPGLVWNNKSSNVKFKTGGVGTDGESSIGGAVLIVDYINDVTASIKAGATVYGDSVAVQAESKTLNVDVAASGGEAENFGFNGAGTWIYVDNSTTAQIEDGVTLTVGDAFVADTTDSLSVRATDRTDSLNLLGGVAISESIGIGATVGFNTVVRDTRAVIGKLNTDDSANNTTGNTTSINSLGDISIEAINKGWVGSIGLAGAVATGGSTEVDEETGETSGSQNYGVGISGISLINEVTDTADAYMRNVDLTLGEVAALAVNATNKSKILSLGGAIAAVKGNSLESTASLGLAGAYGQNTVEQTTQAYLEAVNQQSASESLDQLKVEATNTSQIMTVNLGGAGAIASDANVAIAGAVTINEVNNKTQAYLKESTLDVAGTTTVEALDKSKIHGDAGGAALAVGLSADSNAAAISVGVGLAYNDIDNTTRAFIDNTYLDSHGDVSVTAKSTSAIEAFALGAAVSVSSTASWLGLSLAGAGAGSKNDINNTIAAYVSNGSTVNTFNGGTVTVSAKDESDITADAGGYALAVALSGSAAAGSLSVGVSIAENEIKNNIDAYVEQSTVTSDGAVSIDATSTATVDALSIGGAAAVSTGELTLSLSGAGAGTTNTIDNAITAQVSQGAVITTTNNATVAVTATDDSMIKADSGGVAIAATLGSTTGIAASVGASVAVNQIGKGRGHSVQALVDGATINSEGDVTIAASSDATIDGLSFAGAVAAAGSANGLSVALAGSGTAIKNKIKMTIGAAIQNGGDVQTDADVSVSATDDSKIKADAGAVSLSISASSGVAGAGSVGVAIADNDIRNSVTATVDNGIVDAKALTLNATSTTKIDTFGLTGTVSVAVGGGGALSGAAAGTEVTNTIENTIQAYIQNDSDIDTHQDISLLANDHSTIETFAIGGSIAISGGSGSGSAAIGTVILDNDISNTVQAFVGDTSADSTRVKAGDDLLLTAESTLTLTENTAVAASLAVSKSPAGVSLSGAGASVDITTTNTVEAFIRNVDDVKATDDIHLTATDNPTVHGTVGTGALAAGVAGASVGVSTTDITIDNTVRTYIDDATVNSDDLMLSATSTPDIEALAVATSVAVSIGGAGAGAEATATVKSDVEARIGSGADITATTVSLAANSTDNVKAESYGVSAGMVSIGAAVAHVETRSTTQAHVTDAIVDATDLSIDAMGDGKVNAAVTSIAGGLGAAGNGNSANATFDSTVQAFVGDNADIDLDDQLQITATATPDANANALGISGAVGAQVGYSEAIATVKPRTEAYIGNNSEVDAKSLTLKAEQQLPGGNDAAHAEATGSGGALYGSVNAAYSEATNTGEIAAFVGDNSELTITNDASITASGISQQDAKADGYNGGILAAGANIAHAESDLATEAYLGTGVNISAQNLNIQAVGNDNNFAESVSGGGGVVSGRASDSTTKSKSSAKVRIEDGDAASGNVEIDIAGQLTIKADQTSDFNGKADSVNASVVGGSGAYVTNKVNSEATVEIGVDTDNTENNLVIEAGSVDIDATQTILKAELSDASAEAASGGVADGSAVAGETTIENTTLVSLGDSSTSNGFGTRINTTGDIDLNAFNDVSAWDKSNLNSGGLISVALATSEITHERNEAIVQIQDADLYSDGDITLSALANVNLENKANASSYGLAGVPSARSSATTDTENLIQLNDGAYLRTEGDVNLLAGQDAQGNENQIELNSRSNIWNYTVVPIDGPGSSKASVTLANAIDIASGATVESVQDVTLLTAEGSVSSLGVLKSQDAYEALASAITGASTVSVKNDRDDITSTSGVTVDGTVNVSIENKEFLTIEQLVVNDSNKITVDGQEIYDVTVSQSDGVGAIALSAESLSNNISTYILQLQELKTTYAGDASAEAGYQAQIDYWTAQLDEVGDASEVAYIEVPDISVKVGDIRVMGDYLQGSGELNSPGDAEIKITNNSPYYLRVNNLNVPEVEGGRILFNSASVTSNSDITNRNHGQTANFSQVTTAGNSDEPLIEVNNTFDPTFEAASGFTDAPDMEILGSVTNIKGTVRLTNDEGSIVVDGNLNAKTIDIQSGSDFILNDQGTVKEFSSSNVSTGNDTITIANHGFTTGDRIFYEAGDGDTIGGLSDGTSYFAIVLDSNTIKLADSEADALAYKEVKSSKTSGLLGGIVSAISDAARALSDLAIIDFTSTGSGSNHRFSLTDDLGFFHAGGDPRSHLAEIAEHNEINGQNRASDAEFFGYTPQPWSDGDFVDTTPTSGGTIASNDVFINARYLNINGLIQSGQDQRTLTLSSSLDSEIATFQTNYNNGNTSSHYLTLSDDTDGTGIDAKYNAQTGRIEVDGVTVEGGYMQLTGHILSTGNGELRVMDGFGKIDIDNQTNYEMVINNIDAGGGGNETGVEGRLQIIDTAQTDSNGDSLITTYTRIGDHITKTTSSGQTSTLQNTRSAEYDPLAGQAYTWVTGQGTATEITKTYESTQAFGVEVSEDDQTSSTTRYLDETPLIEGAFVSTGYTTADDRYEYNFDTLTTDEISLVSKETWRRTRRFLGIVTSRTYYRRDTYSSGTKYVNTHSYSASETIDINFIGQDTGEVSIDSDKTVYLEGAINNIGGTTTLNSDGALIANSIGNLVSSDSLSVTTGGQTTLYTDVDQLTFSSSGDVSIQDFQGDVTLSGESTSTGGIAITTEGSLLSSGAGANDLSAHQIDLTSENGSIGSASQSLRIDSWVQNDSSTVQLEAAGDIHLTETTGDLYLTSAVAGGDVNLNVTGGLFDNNENETTDPYSQEQLESLWSEMGLTTDRSAEAIASFKQQAVGLYDTYWGYRNLSTSTDETGNAVYTADDYDPNFSYSHSATAQAQLQAQGYSDQEISTLAADKTAEYHALHTLFSGGNTQLSGDDAQMVTQMATIINDLFLDSDFSGQDLTELGSYNPNWIETSYDVSSGQQAQLTQGSQWTEYQLTNTVRSSVFGSVTDTQSTLEEANITADGNVTINATGGLGHTAGSITISDWGSNGWSALSAAEKTAFSYAERDDITYYDASGNVLDNPSLTDDAISQIVISLKQDVDIDAKGELNITAGAQVFLGSEQDININQVSAGDLVRIKSADGIYNVATSSDTTNIVGSDLVLEAGTESIGTSSAAINVALGGHQHYYNGKLYLLSGSDTWENVQAQAQAMGGNLVTINDAAEEQWLQSTFGDERLWIGLTDKVTEGEFEWINGETSTYTNWTPGEPSNSGNNEDYVDMNFSSTRQWNDVGPTHTQRGVIELDVKQHNGKLYLLSGSDTWENVQTQAQAMGGNLVTINDAAEEQWLQSTFGDERLWIGLTDKVTEGEFEWINGETSTYRNWTPGEPSNSSNNEDYVDMNFSSTHQWNDVGSTHTQRGVIELDFQHYYNDKLYLLSDNDTWENAQAQAQAMGGNLVTINDAAEEQWLQSTFGNERLWIGLTDKVTEGEFEWISGETSTYRNWTPGEPSNSSNNEDYVDMNFSSTHQWNDVGSTHTQRGVIELDVKQYNGKFYLTTPTDTWENAQTIAKSLGGNLVTINDAAEENWIKSQYSDRMWIGLTDKAVEGEHEWISGETSTYRNWAPGEPNDSGGNEDYIEMNFGSSLQWNDTLSTTLRQGLVELRGNADLVARAQEGVYISSQADLNVDTIYGGDVVELTSANAIIDNNGDETNIKTSHLTLNVNNLTQDADTLVDGLDITLIGEDTVVAVTNSNETDIQASGNVAIDLAGRTNPVRIEGSDGDDTITLFSSDETLNGAADIVIEGSDGNDTIVIRPTEAFDANAVVQSANGSTLTGTGLGNIQLSNVEEVQVNAIATDDAINTTESATQTIDLLNNDTGANTLSLTTITAIAGESIAVGQVVTTESGAQVTLNADSTVTYDPNGQFEWLTTDETTQDSFTYTLTNEDGSTEAATVNVTITGENDGPQAVDDFYSINQSTTHLTLKVQDNDTDPEGDSFDLVKLNGKSAQITRTSSNRFGSFSLTVPQVITLESGATVLYVSNGTFSYNSRGRFNDLIVGESVTESFTYTIKDALGNQSTASVYITAVGENKAPDAQGDAATTTESAITTIDVLSNDSDENVGDNISITQIEGQSVTVGETIVLDSGALVTWNTDNSFAYDPNGQFDTLKQGETSNDSFTYTISDDQGATSTATVNVTVEGELILEKSQGENFSPNGVLDLDGYNDYVAIENSQSLDFTTAITVETWIKVDSFDRTWQAIVTKGDNSWRLHRERDSNQLNFSINGVGDITGSTNVNDGQWHHVAVTYDGSQMILYVDGEIDAQSTASGLIPTNNYRILVGSNDQSHARNFNGKLDEVRLWSDARSQAEIQASMNHSLTGTEEGLVANWNFDETTGSAISNKTGSDYSGSLLNGQNNNFVTDDSLIITPSFDALKATISTENRTLSLDGINDRVSIPNSTSINFGTNDNFTVETLVKVDPNQLDLGNGDNDIIEKWSGSGGYPFVIRYLRDSGKIVAARYDGSTSASVYSTVSLNDGQFHHIAFVKNGDTLQLYIDGQLDGSAADTTSNSTQNDSALFVGNRNDKNHFRGELDELRIWNTARSKEDINAFRDSKLTGAESGLVGYWNFDEDSSGSTVIQDIKGNLNGTLISGQSNHITAYADQDIDNDGDLDRIIHNGDGSVQLSRNNGSSLIEQFGIDNPFEGITLKAGSSIAFGDVDDDGDTDAFAVNADGTVSYYQTQDGLMSRVTGSDSPVDELTGYSDIMFIDLDGDGDLDLVLKDDLGLTNYLENL